VVPPGPTPEPSSSGVLGAEGRYPLHERAAVPLEVGGRRLVPVGPLRMYTCGITPYDVTHVGHASTFVWADLLATLAHATGGRALVARNVTDIDDVLTSAARTRGRPYDELALTQEFLFDRDMRALSVAAPAFAPHARNNVAAVVRLAGALLDVGAAYESGGFVYFRGAHLPEAAGLTEEAALAASEEYGDQHDVPGRESPFDVPVWRPSGEQDPAWPSPWGWGRPGWHAECAAMALSSLGAAVDVLLGGADLTFPHHVYQSAMAEAASGAAPFARTTVHVGEVRRKGRKVAKSTGNLVLVSDLLERFSGAAVRLGLLHRPWAEPWECEERVFEDATGLLAELDEVGGGPGAHSVLHEGVLEALASELDVPRAVEVARAEGREAVRYLLDVLKLRRL
jgi:L-cysteine:1D-myo-inositol 2-amino-2-deoxy-alpha-D-glucopyranoside ligase